MEIKDLRKQIDSIDDELLGLFVKRMTLCAGIAEQKALSNKPVIDAGREREILSRVTRNSPDELGGYARELFSTMFQLSRAYQTVRMSKPGHFSAEINAALAASQNEFPKTATVACQGVEGAYSQQACDKIFSFADIMFFKSFDGVFNAVEKGLCKYGVLPIENSSHGSVDEVYDLMRNHSFHIVHSTKLRISHDLLAAPGTKLEDVREVVSHEQALGQCSKLIASLPNVRVTVCENTAAAAKMVAESDRNDIAAICSAACADIYGLKPLRRSVQDTDNNHTRFIVISKTPEIYPGANRISIMFSLDHTPGALSRVLAQLASIGVNLTKLESRPVSGTDFEYCFYADLEGSVYSGELTGLLDRLESELKMFVFLGAYSEV